MLDEVLAGNKTDDPLHIGYALVEPTAPVVTAEVSAPSE
jgi:hypothetical protein